MRSGAVSAVGAQLKDFLGHPVSGKGNPGSRDRPQRPRGPGVVPEPESQGKSALEPNSRDHIGQSAPFAIKTAMGN